MKCPECGGHKNFISLAGTPFEVVRPCKICKGKGEVDVSNEEWFDTLSTKGKAEIIAQLSSYGGNVEAILLWLQQPHR